MMELRMCCSTLLEQGGAGGGFQQRKGANENEAGGAQVRVFILDDVHVRKQPLFEF